MLMDLSKNEELSVLMQFYVIVLTPSTNIYLGNTVLSSDFLYSIYSLSQKHEKITDQGH